MATKSIAATNIGPVVSLTSPADYSQFFSGTNVTLTATATDSDGTVGQVDFFIDGFKISTDTTAPYSMVWSNVALGSYTVTAVARDNNGATNVSAEVHVTVTFSPTGTNTLVSQGSIWKYLDNGTNPGTAWREPGFDDATWASGRAQLGYGDGDEATVVSFGPNANSKYITTYFRRAFDVVNPSAFGQLIVKLLRDDGAVIYLNGQEIFRSNMPGGAISNSTLASVAIGGSDESTFFSGLSSATNLVSGRNLLAVEMHQAAPDSSDISFDLQLIGTTSAGGPSLRRGPYLQSGTTNGIIVRWRTDLACDSRISFGTNSANLDQSFTDGTSTTEHIVTLTNLQSDTKYFYAIAADTNTLATGTNYFFATGPPIGVARPLRLWVLGDSGTANANARAVRDAYLSYAQDAPADIWLMLGDNAYNSGLDTEYQAAVFDLYPMVLRNKVLWPTIGNHETDQQQAIANFTYLDIFTLPSHGEAGGLASGTERYYSFDYANIHFVCLDAMTSSRATDGPMAGWLASDLAATAQEWIIAFWHHPPYTKGSHNSDTEIQLIQMRENFLPILESFGVDLVLCGHSHSYERSYFLNGHYGYSSTLTPSMKVDAGNGHEEGDGAYAKYGAVGAAYVVAGNGGQTSGGTLDHPAMFLSLNELGSLIIDVNSNRLDLKMLSSLGTIRDYFTIVKPPAPSPVFERFAEQGFKARRSTFADHGAVLANAGPSTANAGNVSVAGAWLFYSPSAGYTGTDSFNFALNDGRTGAATVNIKIDQNPSENLLIDALDDGSVRIRFSGIPDRRYSIQFTSDIANPAWETLATRAANSLGAFEYVDLPPVGTTRFYRSTSP